MTTITINEDIDLKRTTFDNVEQLFEALRETSPLRLHLADIEEFSEETRKKVEDSRNNPSKKLTNFQG